MNITNFFLATMLAATLCVNFACGKDNAETIMRTWTSRSGKTIEASFQKTEYDLVYLKNPDGKVVAIRMSKLSAEDQQWVRKSTSNNAPATGGEKTESLKKAPEAIVELFGQELTNSKEDDVSVNRLTDKTIGIYFSAHWCPPCRAFTPKLVEFYNQLKKEGKAVEIVFVSSDRNKDAMFDYMDDMDMPWLAIPFGDKRIQKLKSKFGIRGIPSLVILGPNGKLKTKNGRGDVMNSGTKAFEKWQ